MKTQYTIVIKGHLKQEWAVWFNGLHISYTDEGNTILQGAIQDQAALRGVLIKVWDLNLILLSVEQVSQMNNGLEEEERHRE